MNNKIWLSSPHMGGKEAIYVKEAFDTNWIAPLGPHVDNFEKDLLAFTGTSAAAALSSGTAAIHLSLILLGVQAGDEVICQSFTFSASANPIVYQGAIPIFVDSEKDTWNMCPLQLRIAIEDRIARGKKPKAIIPVHLYGMPSNMKAIVAIANEFDIPVIEDAAEAIGSSIDSKGCGSFGILGVLSFNGNKIITTSGGGALVSDNVDHIVKARFLATQARDEAPHYQHSQIGYNYRMSNVCAGIGRGQMEVLPQRIEKRRANHAFYLEALKDIAAIGFLTEPDGYFSNRWLTCILVNPALSSKGITRETIRLALEKENIECRPLWKPMHLQPVFSNYPFYGDGTAEGLFENGLCLPSGSNLSQDDLDRVVAGIRQCFD
jgi:dTDP-4-amino-4,6-dideoxygalactose transaminase